MGNIMADILQDFPINAAPERVFEAISTPAGLNEWWTDESHGAALAGAEYQLSFGPAYQWRARVIRSTPPTAFELEMIDADADWRGTIVRFHLDPGSERTVVRFAHLGWRSANEHYRISSHCWAMYLRILRRYLEHGERVPYDDRLDA
jgi:uncharacterized protein YndB with AHSA1/START domain